MDDLYKIITRFQAIINRQEKTIYDLNRQLKRKEEIINLLNEKIDLIQDSFIDEQGHHKKQMSLWGEV